MNAQFTDLVRLSSATTEMGGLFLEAAREKSSGDYAAAARAYDAYLTAARSHLSGVLSYNDRYPDHPFEVPTTARPIVNALMTYADVLDALGKYPEAEARRDEAQRIARDYLGESGSADTKRSRAASLISKGRFNAAITNLMEARDLIREQGDYEALARVTLDLADVLQWLGDFERAEEEVARAERILRPALENGRPTSADVLTDLLASISHIMQDEGYDRTAERSAEVYRAATEVLFYKGLIARARHDWEVAEASFKEVLPDYRDLGVGDSIEWQLAQVMVGRGDYSAALNKLRGMQRTFEVPPFRAKKSALMRSMAECLFKLGDPEGALPLALESVSDLTNDHFDPDLLWRAQLLEAEIRTALGDAEGALDAFSDAVTTTMSLRRAPLGYRLDSTFLKDKVDLFSKAIDAAITAGAYADACRFIESLKSRSLAAVLSVPAAGAGGGLAAEFQEMTRTLDALEYQLYANSDRDAQKKRRDLLKKRADLLERIRISDPRWHTLSEPVAVDLDRLRARLSSRNQAALTLYFDPPTLTTVLVAGGGIEGGSVTVSEAFTEALDDFAKGLQSARYDPFKNDFSDNYGVALEDLIPANLLAEAVVHESVIMVPHGTLHLVPWAGMLYKGERLFEHAAVGISPNLSLLETDAELGAPENVYIVGVQSYEHLAGIADIATVEDEVSDVKTIYGGANVAELLLNDAATEDAFWRMLDGVKGDANLLHLSCHGVMVPAEPMNSGLLLSDAKVDAAEIAGSRLPFREVVLSACSTGWRPSKVAHVVLRADEVLGVPAGFLEARAHAVLVSIPKAQGGAARQMVAAYHTHRSGGLSPLFAFREAQRDLLCDGVHPGNWVGFTLYGFV